MRISRAGEMVHQVMTVPGWLPGTQLPVRHGE